MTMLNNTLNEYKVTKKRPNTKKIKEIGPTYGGNTLFLIINFPSDPYNAYPNPIKTFVFR